MPQKYMPLDQYQSHLLLFHCSLLNMSYGEEDYIHSEATVVKSRTSFGSCTGLLNVDFAHSPSFLFTFHLVKPFNSLPIHMISVSRSSHPQ